MVVKLIGRTTDLCGKTLWEIVGNLKNFGVGRLVKRNMWERYQEPSFFRICRVHTDNNEEVRKVTVWAEKIFRGRRYPQLVELYSASYKPDYRLIPRSEEEELWKRVESTKHTVPVLPKYIEFPPLLKHLIMKDMNGNQKGGGKLEEPKLKLIIQSGRDNHYGEPTDEVPASQTNYKPFHLRKINPL